VKAIVEVTWGPKPPGWFLSRNTDDGSSWDHRDGRRVIASIAKELDGKRWLHLSMSRRGRLPNYEDMKYLKRHWAGDESKAIEVHAPAAEHVNINPNVRHLWVCLDGDPLPDFARGGKSI
jgi:hypothetical protein